MNVLLPALAGVLLFLARSSASAQVASPPETTPDSLPDGKSFIYRMLDPVPLRVHVFYPPDWQTSDKRTAFVFFFGGGWQRGTPAGFAETWAKYGTQLGMVGFAPDYRTKRRFGTDATSSVVDARAAVRWIGDHAGELGIDPRRIVVGGISAGAHLALWTALSPPPPGAPPSENPLFLPAALFLLSPPSDTGTVAGFRPERFGGYADAFSPILHLHAPMPPTLLLHGEADTVVPFRQSVTLNDKLTKCGTTCEFVSVPDGSHNFLSQSPEWTAKTRVLLADFLGSHGLLSPAARQ